MNKKIILLFLFPIIVQAQRMYTIGELFDSLKTHPTAMADDLRMEQARIGRKLAYSKLYPNIDVVGRFDYSSTPTAMLPVPPNDLLAMVKQTTEPQPFSERIYRAGAIVSMPIFVASIYTMAAKANMMYQSSEDQKFINLLKNEAIVVSANANLHYLQAMKEALAQKKTSLQKTKEFVVLKVDNGRAPGSALVLINNAINQVDIAQNDLALQWDEVVFTIRSLTGVTVFHPVPMEQIGTYKNGDMKSLDPLRKKLEADKLDVRAEIQKLFPTLTLQGSYSNNFANAYNNSMSIHNELYTIGVVLKIPLFAVDQYTQIQKSNVDVGFSENELTRMAGEIAAQSEQLQKSVGVLENSIELYTKSINDKEALLKIANVSYSTDQMSLDDHLKYQDDLVLEKSKLFKAEAQKWQALVKLAVIFGNPIEEIVQ
jgi:outer membrane protein TolC